MYKGLAILVAVALAAVTAGMVAYTTIFGMPPSCLPQQQAPSSSAPQGGPAPEGLEGNNPEVFTEVDLRAKGNNRLVASMYFASFIESRRNNQASNGYAFGPFQIEQPGVVHKNVTVAQARDPVFAVNFMFPQFEAALQKVDPGLWLTDPMSAAEQTAFKAEKPALLYRTSRGIDDVVEAWENSLAWMQTRGISTDFSGNPSLASQQPPAVYVDPALAGGGPRAPPAMTADQAIKEFGLGAVKPQLAALVAEIAPLFGVTDVGGYRANAVDMNGHPAGLAADLMTSTDQGNQVADYLMANADRLSVDYIIWRQRIWFADQPGAGWAPMADRGSATQNHMDHVHVNVTRAVSPNAGMPAIVLAGQQRTAQGGEACVPAEYFAAGAPVGSPSQVSADAQTLARQVLALPSDRIQYIFGSRDDLQATADGTRPAANPGESCPAGRPVALSPELLQLILDITKEYSVTLGSVNKTRGCDGGRHPLGRGADFNKINGVSITGGESQFTPANQELYREFMDYVASVLPRGNWVDGRPVGMGGMGQQQCLGTDYPELDGRNIFSDACTHIHVDVGVAASPI